MRALRKMVWEGYLLGLTIVHKELYTGLTRLAITLEREVFPHLRQKGIGSASLGVEGMVIKVAEEPRAVLPLSDRLTQFFTRLGIKVMRLDTILESNQLVDILKTIHGLSPVMGRKDVPKIDTLGRIEKANSILGDGYNAYCAITRFSPEDRVLSIKYHYCELKYSRATGNLKRGSRFHDHRFFFHKAPRYGIASGLGVMALVIVSSYLPPYLSITLSIIIGLLVGLAVFLAFQTIGSLEYDKEELGKRIGGVC